MFISAYHRYTGTDIELYSTRFKEQLLSRIPGLQAHKQVKQTALTSDNVATETILAALSYSGDQNGLHLEQAAKLVCQDLFDGEASFLGNFGKDCQTDSVPNSLLMLSQMIPDGTSLSLAADNQNKNTAFQLSQLIKFNALKRQQEQKVINVRHRSFQNTTLPVNTGLLLHSWTQKKSIINKVLTLGLSVSYNKVDEIQSAITDQVCQEYQTKGLVLPFGLADLCSLLQLLIMLITTPVLVLPGTIFTGQASHCFKILIHRQQTIKSCLICHVKHWVERGTLNSACITQNYTYWSSRKPLSHKENKFRSDEATRPSSSDVQTNGWSLLMM